MIFLVEKVVSVEIKAISELNGKDVQGRELKVSEAKPMEERPERPRRSFGGDRGGDRGGYGGGSRGGVKFNRRRI